MGYWRRGSQTAIPLVLTIVSALFVFNQLMFLAPTDKVEACTTFAAIGSVTSEGQPIVVENTDVEIGLSAEVFTKANPGRYSFTAVYVLDKRAGPGGYPKHGLNEKGLALVMTAVDSSSFNSSGWYIQTHAQDILERAATPEEAYRILTQNIRAHGFHGSPYGGGATWTFSNATHIIAAESTSDTVVLVKSFSDGYVVQTNHYTILKQYNKQPISTGSMKRLNRAAELIEKNRGKLNVDLAVKIARDHENGVYSICCHKTDFSTVASSVMSPSKDVDKSVMWTAIGHPCQNEYVIRSMQTQAVAGSGAVSMALVHEYVVNLVEFYGRPSMHRSLSPVLREKPAQDGFLFLADANAWIFNNKESTWVRGTGGTTLTRGDVFWISITSSTPVTLKP